MGEWTIHASLRYDKGSIRKNNEDAFYFNGKHAKLAEMDEGASLVSDVPSGGTLWAVCDGMGGQSNGEMASYTAVTGMADLQEHLKGRDFETAIQNWVRQANKAVAERADGGGSTLAMLYCTDQYVQAAHIGDSRIYRYHQGELVRVSRDHSKVEMLLEAGMISADEARNHPQKNVITRYLGMNSEYICEATVSRKIPLVHGDRYVLCSDGITDMLTDEEIAAALAKSKNAADCAELIKEAVFASGARDNLTVIVLELESSDGANAVPEEPELFMDKTDDDDEPTVDEETECY